MTDDPFDPAPQDERDRILRRQCHGKGGAFQFGR